SAAAREWIAAARKEGKRVGRKPGPRFERCCPACRGNFVTPREEQLFCSKECRYSPVALEMVGAKGGAARRGCALSPQHRAKLQASSRAAARPGDKRRAALESLRARCLKAARLLLDAGYEVSFAGWEGLRDVAYALGASHFPSRSTLERLFRSDAD